MEGAGFLSSVGSQIEMGKQLTERQQMALLLQMSSENPSTKSEKEASAKKNVRISGSPSTPKSLLRRNQRGETPLHVAAIRGDHKRIKYLLGDGAPVDATDFAGWTPLHEAANRGHFEACRVLLQSGANSNALGLDNYTPLHDACVNGHFPIVHLLLQHGADPKLPNLQGKTPIDVAGTPVIYRILTEFKLETDLGPIPSSRESLKSSGSKTSVQWIEDIGLWTPPSQKSTPNRPKVSSSLRRGLAESWAGSDHNYGKSDPSLGVSVLPLTPESAQGKGRSRMDNYTSDSDSENIDYVYQVPSYVPRTSKKSLLQENNALESPFPGKQKPIDESHSNQQALDHSNKKPADNSMDNKDAVIADNSPDGKGKDASKVDEPGEGELLKTEKNDNKEETGVKRPADQLAEEEPEEDGRRKRKKEDAKEAVKTNNGSSTRTGKGNSKTKQNKQTNSNLTASSSTIDRKSPSTVDVNKSATTQPSTALSSPKRPLEDSDEDSKKSSDSNHSTSSQVGPKVPPLKIVLVEHETGMKSGKSGGGRLPYVVSSEEKEKAEAGQAVPHSGAKDTMETKTVNCAENTSSNDSTTSGISDKQIGGRVTRSSQRAAASLASQSPSPTPNNSNTPPPSSAQSESEANDSKERSNSPKTTEGGAPKDGTCTAPKTEEDANMKASGTMSLGNSASTQPASHSVVDVHPRKRKLRPRETETANESLPMQAPAPPEPSPATNCYEMYLHIRRQIDRRRKNLFPIQPKPPQGFKDYLMNRCTYVLAGNSASRLSVPMMSPPPSLPSSMRDLFTEQEKERYKLRMQHLIEKEKLVLSVEQEILRVHGRAARALANQALPFSVCTLLRDEEVYSAITPEQEEKDRNPRSRYNGRLFLSWLQDVDDKWEKIKEAMLLRHHNEAESLHAVQKMDWEWKLKELSLCEPQVKPTIDDLQVPMVHVSDDFDLLPA